jgi:hypothetical protein
MPDPIAINGRVQKMKRAFRMEYSIGINIRAKPVRIWSLLTNAKGFPGWNTTVKSIEGRIAAGETIQLVAAIAPDRIFRLNIVEFAPEKKMVWIEGNAMFKGVRTYTLNPEADGTTSFTMSEVYTGLMLPMIAGSLPDFSPVFEQYASDLKREAEKQSS